MKQNHHLAYLSRRAILMVLGLMLLTATACQPFQLLPSAQPEDEAVASAEIATTEPVEEPPEEPTAEPVEEPAAEPTEQAVEEPVAEEPATPVSAATAAIGSTIATTDTVSETVAPETVATEPITPTVAAETVLTETVAADEVMAMTETAEISTTVAISDVASDVTVEETDEAEETEETDEAEQPVLTIADIRARQAAEAAASENVTSTASVSETVVLTETGATENDTQEAVALFASINTDGSNLNVRSQPSVDGAIVAKLPREAVVEVLELNEAQDWYRVEISPDGSSGWVSADFAELIELEEAEGETASDTSTSDAETNVDISASDVVTSSQEISDTEAISELSKISESLQTTITVEFDVPTAITQPDNMNVRAGPGTNYPPVTAAPAGTQYEILGRNFQGDWLQVSVPDLDEPGWIFATLAEIVGPTDAIPILSDEELPEPPTASAPEAATVAASSASASVAVAAPPPAGGGFFGYGVQAHMLGGGRDAALDATSNLGFNWIKQQVQWREFEGNPGSIDFSELRRIADAASGRGISVLFSVVNAPDWAREGGFDPNVGGPPADPQSYANFVGRLAGDFCGSGLKAIEVWNEQNLHYEWGNKPLNPAEYMTLLRAAYGSIKGACPSMLVISGAPTPAGPNGNLAMDDFAYLEAMYQNGLASVADGIGVHPSGYNVPPSVDHNGACAAIQQTGNTFNGACDTPHHSWSFLSTMLGYRNIMNVYGDSNKRLWPTEFGWAAGGALHPAYAYANDNDFNEQAAWTVESYQMMRNWGWVGPAFLWNLNFRVIADGTEKAQWGIVRNDYTPLPVYDALRAMAK